MCLLMAAAVDRGWRLRARGDEAHAHRLLGWNYADWRGRLYPAGVPPRRWLSVYAERFDTVEVN